MSHFCNCQYLIRARGLEFNRNVNLFLDQCLFSRRKRESENEAKDYLPLNRAYKVSPTKVYDLPQCTVDGQLVYPSEDNHLHEHAALILPYI